MEKNLQDANGSHCPTIAKFISIKEKKKTNPKQKPASFKWAAEADLKAEGTFCAGDKSQQQPTSPEGRLHGQLTEVPDCGHARRL